MKTFVVKHLHCVWLHLVAVHLYNTTYVPIICQYTKAVTAGMQVALAVTVAP